MGILAAGAADLAHISEEIFTAAEKEKEKYGFLGSSNWIGNSHQATDNELLTIMYFRDMDGLHRFAHDDIHREGWRWWNDHVKQYPHIAIWHEAYNVPAGRWESVYINTEPTMLGKQYSTQPFLFFEPSASVGGANSCAIGATTHPRRKADSSEIQTRWHSPIIDSRKGLLKTMGGRMGASKGHEHDWLPNNPYDD